MNIGGVEVGGVNPCRFVFEVSNNHNGSLLLAHKLIDGAKAAGAEFLKVQAFLVDELVALRGDGPAPAQWGAQGFTMRSLYEQARTPLEWLPELFAHARDIGLVPFASVFGWESLDALRRVANPCYKIAALDNRHDWLLEACHATRMPVLVSTNERHGWRVNHDHLQPIGSLYAPAGYPTPPETVLLPPSFVKDGFVGLSSHCLAPELPIAAVARGCKLIEMHGMLDETPSALEANISLTVSQFRRMVEAVRATEVLLA